MLSVTVGQTPETSGSTCENHYVVCDIVGQRPLVVCYVICDSVGQRPLVVHMRTIIVCDSVDQIPLVVHVRTVLFSAPVLARDSWYVLQEPCFVKQRS